MLDDNIVSGDYSSLIVVIKNKNIEIERLNNIIESKKSEINNLKKAIKMILESALVKKIVDVKIVYIAKKALSSI